MVLILIFGEVLGLYGYAPHRYWIHASDLIPFVQPDRCTHHELKSVGSNLPLTAYSIAMHVVDYTLRMFIYLTWIEWTIKTSQRTQDGYDITKAYSYMGMIIRCRKFVLTAPYRCLTLLRYHSRDYNSAA